LGLFFQNLLHLNEKNQKTKMNIAVVEIPLPFNHIRILFMPRQYSLFHWHYEGMAMFMLICNAQKKTSFDQSFLFSSL